MAVKRLLLIWILVLSFQSVFAGDDEQTRYDQFLEHLKKPYFKLDLLLQTVGDFQIERSFSGTSGFSIATLRVRISGKLDYGFGYFIQTNLIRNRPLLDAFISYHYSPQLIIDVGQFKAPFSGEFLTYAADIDFVDRAQVVNVLVPGRQQGIMTRGELVEKSLFYRFGLFNGNGLNGDPNDNNRYLYAARLTFMSGAFQASANLANSEDNSLSLNGFGSISKFTGKRRLAGVEFRWTPGNALIAAEWIGGTFNGVFDGIEDKFKPAGFHVTAGYFVLNNLQLLLRYDRFRPDASLDKSQYLIIGSNILLSKPVSLQLNYYTDLNDSIFKHQRLLLNFQLSL